MLVVDVIRGPLEVGCRQTHGLEKPRRATNINPTLRIVRQQQSTDIPARLRRVTKMECHLIRERRCLDPLQKGSSRHRAGEVVHFERRVRSAQTLRHADDRCNADPGRQQQRLARNVH